MREIHNVVAVAVHHNGVAQSLIERPLPHLRVGVGLPAQPLAGETETRHIENAHLLARERGESRVAGSWNEAAVIAQHDGKQAELTAVAGQKEDVAKRVILTLGNIFLLPRYRREFGLLPVMLSNYGCFIPASGDTAFATFARQQVSIFNMSCLRLSGEGLRWQPYAYSQMWQGTLNEALGDTVVMHGDGDYIMYFTHEAKR